MCESILAENVSFVPSFDAESDCGLQNATDPPLVVIDRGIPLSEYTEYKASVIIYQYNLWVFWAIGLLGNSAALLTITKMKSISSVFIYIGCLSACDVFYLTVKLIYEQMRTQIRYLGSFGCGPLLYFLHWSGKTSHWIILLMTVERMIAVCFPFKVSVIYTKRNVALTMIFLAVFQGAVNCHYLFSNHQSSRGGGITCTTKPEYKDFRTKTLWLFFTLSSIIPCGGVLLMNLIMGAKLAQAAKNKIKMTQDETKTGYTKQTQRVTLMLMTVSIAFLLLVTPGPVFYLYMTSWNFRSSVSETALYYLLREIVNAFINADHAINFFLYFLSGTKFRQSFLSIFFKRDRKSVTSGATGLTSSVTKATDRENSKTAPEFKKV